jgi:hypothetical protein
MKKEEGEERAERTVAVAVMAVAVAAVMSAAAAVVGSAGLGWNPCVTPLALALQPSTCLPC